MALPYNLPCMATTARLCIVALSTLLSSVLFAQSMPNARTVLFIGNSFTYGALSPVQTFRADSVTDLNHEGMGGVPALFKVFADEAGLRFEVSLETVGGSNLDLHYQQKAALIARSWDIVVLQPYSTLDEHAPGNDSTLIEYSARLADLFLARNARVDIRLVATWSRADQTYLPAGHWFGQPIDRMALDLRAACDRAARQTPTLRTVIPVGESWNRGIAAGLAIANPYVEKPAEKIDLWGPDHYHGSTYGYYLEALVIFADITEHDPRTLGGTEIAARELGITPALAIQLQRVAFDTLAAQARSVAIRARSNTGP
jgi:hypothetical protein